jgi:microcompartment protein CcmK/EutM
MIVARIDGYATTSLAHPSLRGQKIVLCTPCDEEGHAAGAPVAAIDPIGAGRHTRVFITTDGSYTQQCLGDKKSPVRNQVIGIVDGPSQGSTLTPHTAAK